MPNLPSKLPSLVSYLHDDIFSQQAFDGQQSNLFDKKSFALKNLLYKILTKSYSSENLEFLSELHAINSNKGLTALNLQSEIAEIEKKYIALNAEQLLNIRQDTLENIRNKPFKRLSDYTEAIKEVFNLIQTNVISSIQSLRDADRRIIINELATDLSHQLEIIISLPTKLPSILQRLSNFSQTKTLESCQQDCKLAQTQLLELASNKLLSDVQIKENFDTLLINIIGKLSESFRAMKAIEKANPTIPKKSVEIEKMIDIFNSSVSNYSESKRNSVNKKIINVRLSETPSLSGSLSTLSVMNDDRPSVSESSQSVVPRSESPSLSKIILPKLPYKPSSRALDSPKEENNNDVKTNFRPRR